MTDATTTTAAVDEHAADADAGGHGHASDLMYIKIAALLAVMTAGEVAWPYIIDDGPVLMWPLLVVMVLKFIVIAAFFMHLKFDSKVLTRVFYGGLFLAAGVYIAALCTFRLFDS